MSRRGSHLPGALLSAALLAGCASESVDPVARGGGGFAADGSSSSAGSAGAPPATGPSPHACGGAKLDCAHPILEFEGPRCGDGVADLDAGEDCDPPQDGACPGACEACVCPDPPGPWRFEEVSESVGLTAVHAWGPQPMNQLVYQLYSIGGGVAATDLDDDGFVDLFVVGCDAGERALYRNAGDGTFVDETERIAAELTGCDASPLFFDADGDGADDLFIGGVDDTPSRLFTWDGVSFVEASAASGVGSITGNVYAASAADFDLDGDLDLALGRWATPWMSAEALFRNDGASFTPVTGAAGLQLINVTFTPNFADVDGDGILDLLFASDFHTSRVFLGAGDGTFIDATTPAIDDQNGMGGTIGDFDGDGHLDWFVTSIWDPDGLPDEGWGISGNRLYRNQGDGTFVDVSEQAGVRAGYWGWGACFADFDNDGDLDLFHTNGYAIYSAEQFYEDPSVLFIQDGEGTFTERAAELGITDTGQGRGVLCFDYDRDGHVDILVQQNAGPLRLYRNNGARGGHWIGVALRAPAPNARGIGARVEVTAGGKTFVGVIRAGSNFASQDPPELHFGLGPRDAVESIVVRRPGGATATFGPFRADQRVVLDVQ